jgi:hypothetical protein
MLVLVCPPDVSSILTPLFKHLSMLQIFFENMQHDCSPHVSWVGASYCSGALLLEPLTYTFEVCQSLKDI